MQNLIPKNTSWTIKEYDFIEINHIKNEKIGRAHV